MIRNGEILRKFWKKNLDDTSPCKRNFETGQNKKNDENFKG